MEHTDITLASQDYELIDSGDGMKLERFGAVTLSRSDPQALWKKTQTAEEWKKATAVFEKKGEKGKWNILGTIPEDWQVTLSGVTCVLSLSSFKHVGVFPEQSAEWSWLKNIIKKRKEGDSEKISILNLFGYTGGASVACSLAGAEVTHVDSSKGAIETAHKNRDASGLPSDSIRFLIDDVRKFTEREIKRGKKYDVVIMDPPVYGKGDKKEVWRIEEDLVPLLSRVQKILSDNPLAVVLHGYASGYSHVAYKQLLSDVTKDLGGNIESGELLIKESHTDRLLPAGIFARWSKK